VKVHQPVCPACGALAVGTVERLNGVALFAAPAGSGATAYGGETEIWWDEQRTALEQPDDPEERPDNRPLVCCRSGHEWPSAIDW
jgi:hypothetical protein